MPSTACSGRVPSCRDCTFHKRGKLMAGVWQRLQPPPRRAVQHHEQIPQKQFSSTMTTTTLQCRRIRDNRVLIRISKKGRPALSNWREELLAPPRGPQKRGARTHPFRLLLERQCWNTLQEIRGPSPVWRSSFHAFMVEEAFWEERRRGW